MKHSWIIITLCILLIIAGACLMLMPRTVPIDQCSDVYRQYQGREGLEVSFVKQYRVNDTTAVDVTLIHATTDSAWVSLCEEFISQDYPSELMKQFMYGIHVTQWTVLKSDPHIKANISTGKDCNHLALSSTTKSICIFHTDDIEQIMAISDEMVRRLAH